MVKEELIDQIAEEVGISRGKASAAVNVVLKSVAEELRTRQAVKVGAFGTFTSPRRGSKRAREVTPDSDIEFRPSESIVDKTLKVPARGRAAKSPARR